MNVRMIFIVASVLLLTSCAPRFKVYVDLSDKMNTNGVTILSIDTVKVYGSNQKKVSYVITRDMGKIEASVNKRRQKKIKEEVDKLSR